MQIPRLDDRAIFEHTCESIGMLKSFLLNTLQVGTLVMIFMLGSLMNCIGDVCCSTWDKGMEMADRKRIIMDRSGKTPYMIRYYLLFRDRDEDTRFNIFIHKIIKSDEEDLHDHPWGYFTFILSGGYWETTGDIGRDESDTEITEFRTTQHWRPRFFMQRVNDTHIHRLELKKDKNAGSEIPCWTLFIPFKKTRDWGFYTTETEGLKWTPAHEYKTMRASSLSDMENENHEDDPYEQSSEGEGETESNKKND